MEGVKDAVVDYLNYFGDIANISFVNFALEDFCSNITEFSVYKCNNVNVMYLSIIYIFVVTISLLNVKWRDNPVWLNLLKDKYYHIFRTLLR